MQSYQRFQCIGHTDFNTSGTNAPRSLLHLKVGTHSAFGEKSHTRAYTVKQGPSLLRAQRGFALPAKLPPKEQQEEAPSGKKTKTYDPDHWIDIEEIDAILARTYHANKHEKGATKQWRTAKKVISGDNAPRYAPVKAVSKEEYLLVDGYNIIFAWESLKELAAVNIDGARGKLLDILCNYQGYRKCTLILVFDAYRVKGHREEITKYHNIHVVFTKEAETADQYIEKFAHENGKKYRITVATSDGLEQIIIRGAGCRLLSARDFEADVKRSEQAIREILKEQ